MEDSLFLRKWFIKKYIQFLGAILRNLIKEIRFINNDIEIKTTANNLRAVLYFLKNHSLCKYRQLSEIACSDNPGKKRRFSITYVLCSLHYSTYINVVVQTNEVLPLPSVTPIFSGAGW